MWKIWIILAGVFLILESITTGFLVFWFAIGSVVALIVSLFIDNIVVQTTVFIISSTILIFATRKFCNKFLGNDEPNNVNTIIGKNGKVTIAIDPIEATGQVKIGGETWSASSENGQKIEVGTNIVVKNVDGVKAIVEPIL